MAYQAGPFLNSHLYLQWGGTLPGGEIWSCGLRMARINNGWADRDPEGMLNGVAGAVEAFHSSPGTLISPRAVLTHTKLNTIGVDGHYALPETFEFLHANLMGGGPVQQTPANQVALAVSLLTDYSRGPAHSGRFYLPLPAVSIGSDGRLADGERATVKTAADQFIAALNGLSNKYAVAIHSRKFGAPAIRPVTHTAVGKVPDTQRRRRNKLVEAY